MWTRGGVDQMILLLLLLLGPWPHCPKATVNWPEIVILLGIRCIYWAASWARWTSDCESCAGLGAVYARGR